MFNLLLSVNCYVLLGTMLHFPMDSINAQGEVTGDLPMVLHGTPPPALVKGVRGNALQFNGNLQHGSIPDNG